MSEVGRILPCQYKAHLKIDGLLGGWVGLMVGMRVCRAWEELGMKGRTISGSVGAFFTLLNMSEHVQALPYLPAGMFHIHMYCRTLESM